jgi:hypothetical protein
MPHLPTVGVHRVKAPETTPKGFKNTYPYSDHLSAGFRWNLDRKMDRTLVLLVIATMEGQGSWATGCQPSRP